MAGVEQIAVEPGEAGMRLDRWFKSHYPGPRLRPAAEAAALRPDQGRRRPRQVRHPHRARPDGARAAARASTARAAATGHAAHHARQGRRRGAWPDAAHEDPKVFVFNKPAGLAVQGGSGVSRSVDHMLEAWRNKKGEKPRLVHRLDRDTSGRAGRGAHAACGDEARRKRSAAATPGRPTGRWCAACRRSARARSRPGWCRSRRRTATACASPGTARRAPTTPSRTIASSSRRRRRCPGWRWSRIPAARTSCACTPPISAARSSAIPKYFEADQNWDFPGGIQNRLHLHARRIVIPHPDGGVIDVTAPLPPHMRQSWNLLGFDEDRAGGRRMSAASGTFDRRDAIDVAAAALHDRCSPFRGG